MGVSSDEYRAQISHTRAAQEAQYAKSEREDREALLGQMESYLGTDQQVSGGGPNAVDPAIAPYLNRYEIPQGYFSSNWGYDNLLMGKMKTQAYKDALADTELMSALGGPEGGFSNDHSGKVAFREFLKGMGPNQYAGKVSEYANGLLEQAENLARAGDYAGADALRKQAESFIDRANLGKKPGEVGYFAGGFHSAVPGGGQTDELARAKLNNPTARVVGGLVQQAEGFNDPNSEATQRFRSGLTDRAVEAVEHGLDNSRRRLSQGQRAAERDMRAVSAAHGAARNPYAERAISGRVNERFATEEAMVETQAAERIATLHAEADRFFSVYRDEFRQGTAQFAQNFLQNTSGVREQYQVSMDQLRLSAGNFANRMGAMYEAFSIAAAEREAASQARSDQWLSAGIGLVLTIATLGAGAWAGAAGVAGLAGAGEGIIAAAPAATAIGSTVSQPRGGRY